MIDWASIKKAASEVIAEISEVGPDRVRWRDEAVASTWINFPVVFLTLRDDQTIGIREVRRSAPLNGADDQTIVVCDQKTFTLSVRIESASGPIDDHDNAAAIAARIKVRLGRDSVVERLHGIFGISDYRRTVKVPYVNQGRALSVYVMDLICVTVDNDVDDSPGAGSWIRETIYSGTVTTEAGDKTINDDIKG